MPRWVVRSYLAAGGVLAGATFAFPQYHLFLWGALGFSASAAVVVGTIKNRPQRKLPWLLVALALATFVTGDIVYDLLTNVFHQDNPFPSIADIFYLATPPLLTCGLVGMVRSRYREKDMGALLDALIVTSAAALLSWVYLIQPYVHATDMTLFQKLTSIDYPLGDIAILCVLVRLLSNGVLRNRSVGLLTVGALGLLVADVAYGAIQLNGTWSTGGPTDVGWVLFYLCWGAAALHPSMRELTIEQPRRAKHLSTSTLLVLSATTLVAPGLLVWQAATNGFAHDAGVIGAVSALLFVLVMARMTGLARAQAAQAGREHSLRAIGERLVAASDIHDVDVAAVEGIRALVGSAVTACLVTVPEGTGDRVVYAEPASLRDGLVSRTEVDGRIAAVREADGTLISGTGSAELTRWDSIVMSGADGPRRRVLIAHLGRLPVGSIAVVDGLGAQLTLAADRVELARTLHQRRSEVRFRSLIQNASDIIVIARAGGALRFETPSTEAVLGYSMAAADGLRLESLVHPEDADGALALIEAMSDGSRSGPTKAEWRVRHADGRWLDMEVIANDLSEDEEVSGVVLTLRDVSDRKVLEVELRHQAFHDGLTGLANRVLFNDRVDHALVRRIRSASDVSVLLVDIDDFKVVNDTLGHAAGDQLLVQLGERLVRCLRDGDTVARLGGDEFAICVEVALDGDPDVAATAQRILDVVHVPFSVAGSNVSARVSIGVSSAHDKTEGSADMLREADLALYAAKSAGKSSYHFFEPGLHRRALARLEQRAALESAIEDGELRVHYQPVVRLSDGEIVGMEALVRWQHPTRGLVPPLEFIPLAEESGLVLPLGRWVMNQACADFTRWQQKRLSTNGRPMRIAVNVSPRQLQSIDFLHMVDETLVGHGMDPSWLTVEITESVLVQDTEEVMTRLQELSNRGIVLALDDFGTGYSSLSYLHRFPIQILKIDQSFVRGMDEDDERRKILHAIVSLASSLGLELVAEGIELESQAVELEALGCEYGQGYFLGRPMAADAMEQLLDGQISTAARSLNR